MTEIQIQRDSVYADKLRNYKIELDGVIIGEIASGETKKFEVKPGLHILRLKIDWASSNKLEFKSELGKKVQLRCTNRLKGAKTWLAVPFVIFMPHRYIELERVDD